MHSTNLYVNQLLFYRPYPQSTDIVKNYSMNIDLSQSNIFQKSDSIEADFELTAIELTYYVPISKKIELSFNYPLYYLSRGFMDDGLDLIHKS